MEATETPMRDHIAEFWRLLETEHVRILVDIRRQTEAMTYYDSSSFGDDVAKALVADRAARPSPTGEKVEAEPVGWIGPDALARLASGDSPRETVHRVTSWPGSTAIYSAETVAALEAERDAARAKLKDIQQDLPYVMGWNAGYAHATDQEGDETHAIGVREGYENAIQDIDVATGGDGEFKGSTVSGETVDVPTMKRRIIERFTALAAANARVAELEKAARAVEDWWMSNGMAIMERAGEVGAPYAIFMTRAALTGGENDR